MNFYSKILITASLLLVFIELFTLTSDVSRPLRLSRSQTKIEEELAYFNQY